MGIVSEGEVYFTVNGEGMTDLARNTLLGDDPGHAWRIMSSLIGNGSEDVGKAVLDGTMKLVNDPDDDTILVAVEDNDAEAYLKDLRFIYAGRIKTFVRGTSSCRASEPCGPPCGQRPSCG